MRRLFALVIVGSIVGATAAPRAAIANEARDSNDERRGCCSHHKGVCGCSNNVVMCCDGTGSPTCTC